MVGDYEHGPLKRQCEQIDQACYSFRKSNPVANWLFASNDRHGHLEIRLAKPPSGGEPENIGPL
jgi:hypothetical protein